MRSEVGSRSPRKGVPVDYLFYKLFWYVLAAFAFGLFVGWRSCSRDSGEPQ